MTKLELVKHEQVIDERGQRVKRSVVAVSTSHTALENFCKREFKDKIREVGCGKQTYYTIQETNIEIVPFNYGN